MTEMNRPPISQAPGRVHAVSKVALLFGFLTGPIIWSAHELISLILVPAACAGHGGFYSFTIFGYPGWEWILLLITLLFIVIVGTADLVAIHSWRKSGVGLRLTGAEGGAEGRSGWMAAAGILLSTLFLLGIVAAGVPIFFLSGCR